MKKDEKKLLLKHLKIKHPRLALVHEYIRECHTSLEISEVPKCALITGPTGVGKSVALHTYVDNYKKVYLEKNRTRQTILCAEVRSPASLMSFLETLLEQLNDPYPMRGTLTVKRKKVEKFIKECGIELILLDEFQNLTKASKPQANYEVSECFKSLVNSTGVPFVLFGHEQESNEIVDCNPQLKRRFSLRCRVSEFRFDSPQHMMEFEKLLHQIDTSLPFETLSDLAQSDIAKRIFVATNGLIDSVFKIIRDAAKYAIEKDK